VYFRAAQPSTNANPECLLEVLRLCRIVAIEQEHREASSGAPFEGAVRNSGPPPARPKQWLNAQRFPVNAEDALHIRTLSGYTCCDLGSDDSSPWAWSYELVTQRQEGF
jgi:hypothetical protein